MNYRYATAVALALLLASPAMAVPVKVAPDVTLAPTSGPALRLTDLKGHVVLVDFFASWCVPCRKSFPQVESLHRELAPKGLTVIAVNVDEQSKNARAFLQQFPHTMTVALDPNGVVAQAFDIQAMPTTLILDRSGRVRFAHEGYTDKTIGQYRSEVLQLLAEEK
jgi:thiol-disulfide isomerase/thioredoxin